ncbi:MAG: T9SS type A sorting domain-containing protein, partial [Bacteroidota bacterium]
PTAILMRALALLCSFVLAAPLSAQYVQDNASNYGTWDGNGGSGFDAWTFNDNGNSSETGRFIGGCDVGTNCWGLYSNVAALSEAIRSLTNELPVGGTLSIDMDNGNVDNGGSVGISFRNSSGQNLFEVFFQGGATNYTFADGDGSQDTGIGFTSTGLTITVKPTSLTAFDIDIIRLSDSQTYSVTGRTYNQSGDQRIAQIRFFNFDAGMGGTANLHFNDALAYQDRITFGDGAGWRMMGAPGSGLAVSDLAGINLVQGVTGQYPDAGGNVITGYTNSGSETFVFADNVTNSLNAGQGFLWYLFDNDLDPEDTAFGGGTSVSVALPQTISADGLATRLDGTQSVTSGAVNTDGFYLQANPFAAAFDLNDLSVTDGTIQNTVQIWNGAGYTTLDRSAADTYVAPWQGFFAEVTGASAAFDFSFAAAGGAVRETTNGFVDAGASNRSAVNFALTSEREDGIRLWDDLARIAISDEASMAWDVADASKLPPLSAEYATLALIGPGPDEAQRVKAIESLPTDLDAVVRLPLQLASTVSETFTVSWTLAESLPRTWSLTLIDTVEETEVDLRTSTSYRFEAPSTTQARFLVEVNPTGVVSNEDTTTPERAALAAVYPNPFAEAAQIDYTVGRAEHVRLAIYDVLGREVAVLQDGVRAAGAHTATFEARALPSGLYVVRLEASGRVATRTLMHTR